MSKCLIFKKYYEQSELLKKTPYFRFAQKLTGYFFNETFLNKLLLYTNKNCNNFRKNIFMKNSQDISKMCKKLTLKKL